MGDLRPDEALAWTTYMRYSALIENNMWPLVEKTLPPLSDLQRLDLTENLATIMNTFETVRYEKRKQALDEIKSKSKRRGK